MTPLPFIHRMEIDDDEPILSQRNPKRALNLAKSHTENSLVVFIFTDSDSKVNNEKDSLGLVQGSPICFGS